MGFDWVRLIDVCCCCGLDTERQAFARCRPLREGSFCWKNENPLPGAVLIAFSMAEGSYGSGWLEGLLGGGSDGAYACACSPPARVLLVDSFLFFCAYLPVSCMITIRIS